MRVFITSAMLCAGCGLLAPAWTDRHTISGLLSSMLITVIGVFALAVIIDGEET